jgi:hypothetical protein
MSKEKAPAFQHYPKDILSDINYQMMNWPERGMYRHLIDICWLETFIPADIGSIARLLQVDVCVIEDVWKMIGKCFEVHCSDCSKLVHPRLELERKKQADHRANSAMGGSRSAHKRKSQKKLSNQQCTTISLPSERQVKVNSSSSSSSSFASSSSTSKDKSKSIEASPPGDNGNGNSPVPKDRPKDEAYELFASEFHSMRGTPYRARNGNSGDFVQLSYLRKQLQIGTRETPGQWDKAISNYLCSPLSAYTLADLCVRYDVFVLGEIDRYGKPAGFNDIRQANKSTVKSLQDKGFFDE